MVFHTVFPMVQSSAMMNIQTKGNPKTIPKPSKLPIHPHPSPMSNLAIQNPKILRRQEESHGWRPFGPGSKPL